MILQVILEVIPEVIPVRVLSRGSNAPSPIIVSSGMFTSPPEPRFVTGGRMNQKTGSG